MTWLDHSLLRQLVEDSGSKVVGKLIEQFERLIDYNQPITSYPIPTFSQLMIPMDDNDHTVVAIQCDSRLEDLTLQRVVNMKSLLTKEWEISDHALQLIAVHSEKRLLYWMIPRIIVPLIEQKDYTAQYELLQNGMTMISIFPSNFFTQKISNNTSSGPFCFWNAKVNCNIRTYIPTCICLCNTN